MLLKKMIQVLSFSHLVSLMAWAGGGVVDGGGLGDMSQHAFCSNDRHELSIVGTAAPTYFSGTLTDIQSEAIVIQFGCRRGEPNSQIIWNCRDLDRDHRILQIQTKPTNQNEATILDISGTEPSVIETLECAKLD